MNVQQKTVPAMTLEQFAEAHGLTMQINERALPERHPARFYASFEDCEVKDGSILCSAFGDGPTPEEAMATYADAISLKQLVISAFDKKKRREIPPHRITAD
jgi:hypothetical protein